MKLKKKYFNVIITNTYIILDELRDMMNLVVPKAVFCENSNVKNVVEALQLLNISAHVITFSETKDQLTFENFMNKYGDNVSVDDYK